MGGAGESGSIWGFRKTAEDVWGAGGGMGGSGKCRCRCRAEFKPNYISHSYWSRFCANVK